MNNEINNSHEEILEKHDTDKKHLVNLGLVWRSAALKAMAEVAGLRDKEVEKLHMQISEDADRFLASREASLIHDKFVLKQQLSAKDKEIERLERVIRNLDGDNFVLETAVEQLKASLDLLNRLATQHKTPNI